jgi:hypothetical protein
MAAKKYWPFDVLPPEQQTELHKSQIRFLRIAYDKGFCPYDDGLEWGATGCGGITGLILQRGSSRLWWGEIIWCEADERSGSDYVDNFDCAADAVLRWLRGQTLEEIMAVIRDHIIFRGHEGPSGWGRKQAPSQSTPR